MNALYNAPNILYDISKLYILYLNKVLNIFGEGNISYMDLGGKKRRCVYILPNDTYSIP
jgi:hypothetical protein